MIALKTSIPGPKSQALMKRREQNVAPAGHASPVFIERAQGGYVEDVDGNRLLDLATGIGVMTLGHSNPEIMRAAQTQLERYTHIQWNVALYEPYVQLAEKLNAITPGSFAKKTFLANSGAEAVENAIKIARQVTGRQAVVCFDHSFHGRTYMAMTLTSKQKPFKYGFAPFCPEVYRAPFPYVYRWESAEQTEAHVSEECFQKFKHLVDTQIGPDKTAAVIIEPVTGEGGFLPVPVSFMKNLRRYCSDHGIILIVDEIQTGFGRTGSLFASEQLGIEPDIITLAKGMGGGLPISAVVARAEYMDKILPGSLGGTYGGNPVACAQALTVIDLFQKGDFLKRAKTLGETLHKRMQSWKERYSIIGDVRGLGPMRAMELVQERTKKTPHPDATKTLTTFCAKNGVLMLSAGNYANVVRFLIPLCLSDAELDEGLAIVEKGLQTL